MIDTKNECTSRLYVHDDHLIMNAEIDLDTLALEKVLSLPIRFK